MMKPTTFTWKEIHKSAPAVLAKRILDLRRVREVGNESVVPGIASATFETRTADVVGTRIHVKSKDGTSYVEEVTEWEPERRVTLEVKEFSESMASSGYRFEESWEFQRLGNKTHVVRSLTVYDKSANTRPEPHQTSVNMSGAFSRHLRHIGQALLGRAAWTNPVRR